MKRGMWNRFDNFMRDWYISMPHGWRDVMMLAIGMTLGTVLVIMVNAIIWIAFQGGK